MVEKKICLAGDGWGAIAAYRSLRKTFKNIDLISSDQLLLSEAFKDHLSVVDFNHTDTDLVVCAGYKPIIPVELLVKKTFINIHYSLLPKYRGQHSTVWAILNNEKELGLSIHLMSEYIDDGPVIYQHSIKNDFKSTSVFYMDSFNNWIEKNLGSVIKKFIEGNIQPVNQDKGKATWVGRRRKTDCKIDFSKDHKYLNNFFRALVPPYPLPYIELIKDGKQYAVKKAYFIERNVQSHIGRILNIDNEGIYIGSKDGYVILNQLVDENDNPVDYKNFRIGFFLNQDFK